MQARVILNWLGVSVPFWLLVPSGESLRPRPLVICAHGHDTDGWNTYAGVYPDEEHRTSTLARDGDVGVQAVKRGFVTIVPATRGLAEAVAVTSYTSSNGFIFDCDCCLVPGAPVELGGMANIGALTAPRSLLAVDGQKDGLHSFPDVEAAMARVHEIYSATGAPHRFHYRWGAGGHKFYPDIMWPFIGSALTGQLDDDVVRPGT